VIRGGTVHPLSGPEFTGTVVVQDGRITAAGASVQAPAGARVIEAAGLHVYPGLFDAGTTLGLTEIGAVEVTNDINELGDFTPHLQTRVAVHPATEHIPVARANGITHTMAIPGGGGGRGGSAGGFPGQASVFSLDGWTVEEMELDPGAVMVMEWPTLRLRTGQGPNAADRPYREAKEEYDRAVLRLGEWLDAARAYRGAGSAPAAHRDLRLEALARVVSGELPVLVRADREHDIRAVVEFAETQGLKLILAGGGQAYRVADLLAQKRVPVIIGPTQETPGSVDAAYDELYSNPGKLHAAGVKIAFATFGSSDSRTLPYEAAMSIPFGLPREAALLAVTLAPAEILGVADQVGTIEAGKRANLIVTDGDPLEIRTQIRHLVVGGREVDPMNRHLELYQRHRSRPLPRSGTGR